MELRPSILPKTFPIPIYMHVICKLIMTSELKERATAPVSFTITPTTLQKFAEQLETTPGCSWPASTDDCILSLSSQLASLPIMRSLAGGSIYLYGAAPRLLSSDIIVESYIRPIAQTQYLVALCF